MRTSDDARRAHSGVRAGGGAVARLVEPLWSYLPDNATRLSYRYGSEVRM